MNDGQTIFDCERDRHLFSRGPKRILSLDGGGVRGALSIAFLQRLEEVIEEIEGKPTLLGDWFDLIGGTSTGAVIAAALALGYRVSDVRDFYRRLGPSVFRRPFWRISGLWAKFETPRLLRQIESIVGNRKLDTEDLRTGLCIVTKRLDTGSPWILVNNPKSKFWDTPPDRSYIGNRHYPLVNLIRASAAAPFYFDPEPISIVEGMAPGIFVDGGVTPNNNPAFQLFLISALPQFGLAWKVGPENLTIVSIGTGTFRTTVSHQELPWIRPAGMALRALTAQISDSQELILSLMTWLGDSPVPWSINSELGNLGAVGPPGGNALFRFLRYDVRLEKNWLKDELGVELDEATLAQYRRLDDPANILPLYELGANAAPHQIERKHFL